ncbi:hypothetical protein CXG81DRAFT_1481, partial [Caulochytrium protostelioides]
HRFLPVLDLPSEAGKLRSLLPAALDYIHAHAGQGRNVLVYCQAGVSRSAAVVLAYLMAYHAMSYEQARAHVLAQRPICPNDGFVRMLRGYEAE